MDYFKFDLQLFAAIPVDLKSYNSEDGKPFYAKVDCVDGWYEASVISGADSPTVYAVVQNKTITIKTTSNDDVATITAKNGETMDDLAGYTILMASDITTDGTNITITRSDDTATSAKVVFKEEGGNTLGTVATVSTGIKDAPGAGVQIVDNGGTAQAVVAVGCTVGDMQATDAAATFVLGDPETAQELVAGKVTVAPSGTAVVKENTFTAPAADGEYTITRDGDEVTVSAGIVATDQNMTAGAGGATFTLADAANNLTLADGTIVVTKNAAAKVGEYANSFTAPNKDDAADRVLVLDKTEGVVTALKDFVVNNMTVKGASAEFKIGTSAETLSLTSGQVDITEDKAAVIGGFTYTETSTSSKATVTISGTTITLDGGEVKISETDATLVSGAIEVKNNANQDVTITAGTVTAIGNSGSCDIKIAQGKAATVLTETYTNADDADYATIQLTSNDDGSKKTISLTGGSIKVDKDARAVTSGTASFKNNSDGNALITIAEGGVLTAVESGGKYNVTIEDNGTATLPSGVYTEAASTPAEATIGFDGANLTLSSGTVTINGGDVAVEKTINLSTTHTFKSKTADGKTVTVSHEGEVSDIGNGASCEITALAPNGVITFGENTYKALENAATVTATALDAVTLTDGKVEVSKNAAITANGNVIKNASTSDAGTETVEVDENGNVTALGATGVAEIVIAKATNANTPSTVTVGSTVYTNSDIEKTATIVTENATGTKAKLADGTVSVSAVNVEIVLGSGATIKNTVDTKTITVNATDGLTDVEAEGGCEITLDEDVDAYVKVEGNVYKNSSATGATFAVNEDEVVSLKDSSASVVISKTNVAIKAGDAVITNKADKDVEVGMDTGDGVISAIEDGGSVSVALAAVNDQITIDGKVYTATEETTLTAAYDDEEAKTTVTLTDGSVKLSEVDAALTVGTAVVTSTSTGDVVVDKDGKITATAASKTFTVKNGEDALRTYAIAADQKTMTVTGIADGRTDVYAMSDSSNIDGIVVNTDGTVTVGDKGKVTLFNGDASKAIVVTNTTGSAKNITIGLDGAVSAIDTGAKFSVAAIEDVEGTPTTITRNYVVANDGTSIAVWGAGASVGVYSIQGGTLDTVTVGANGAVTNATLGGINLKLHADSATLGNAAEVTYYYAVASDGTVSETPTKETSTVPTSAPAIDGDANIGFFQVTTTWESGSPVVDVKFVGNPNKAAASEPNAYLGKITIDAQKVEDITSDSGTAKITQIKVAGLSEAKTDDSDITVTNLYHGATAYGTNVVVEGLAYAVLGTANTIALPSSMTEALCYAITPVAGQAADATEVTYQIASSGVKESEITTGTAYINVAPTTATKYTVTYEDNGAKVGESEIPLVLSDASWQGIVLNAANLPTDIKEVVVDTNEGGYTVTGLAHTTKVTGTGVFTTEYTGGYWYKWDETTGALSGIKLDNTNAKTSYYSVEYTNNNDGTVTVKMLNATAEYEACVTHDTANPGSHTAADWLASHNYFVVTKKDTVKDAEGNITFAGSVTVDYVANGDTGSGRYSLKNAKNETGAGAFTIPVDGSGITDVETIDFLSSMSANVNNVVLETTKTQAGIKVTDGGVAVTETTTADSGAVTLKKEVAYAYANGIEIDTSTVANGATEIFYVTAASGKDPETRKVTLGISTSGTSDQLGHYEVTKSENGKTVTVKYVLETGDTDVFDAYAPAGKTKVDLGGDNTITKVTVEATDMVTGATSALATYTQGTITYSTETGAPNPMPTTDTDDKITFFASTEVAGTIDFSQILADTDHILYYEVTTGAAVSGVKKYQIKAAVKDDPVPASGNYFKATYTADTGAIKLEYKGNTIDAATLTKAGMVKVNGATVVTDPDVAEVTKKLTLPEDVACNVVDLPKTVKNVETSGVEATTYAYKDTYNITTTIALGQTKGYAWYKVNVTDPGTKANYGVNTATLVPAGTSEPTDMETVNYVQVSTDMSSDPPTVTIQYFPATGTNQTTGKPYAYDLNGQSITIDPTGAASNVMISIVGVADDPDKPLTTYDNVHYVVKNLTKDQTRDAGSAHGATFEYPIGDPDAYKAYKESFAVTYALGTGTEKPDATATAITEGVGGHIDFKKAPAVTVGTTKFYYKVEKGAPAANGVVTYTVTQVKDKPASGNFITVSYGSAAGISVSYTGADISAIEEQIVINAKGADSAVTAIDLANSGSTINYALVDVRSGVSVENAGKNDTYAQLAPLDLTGKVLTLDNSPKAFWVISADGELTKTTVEPTDGETNYFSVVMTGDNYTIEYVEAGNGTAYDLTKTTLTVDASRLSTDKGHQIDLSNAAAALTYQVTGAPAGVTMKKTAMGEKDTVSYTSTFSQWPSVKGTYTYFVPTEDSDGKAVTALVPSNTPVTVAPEATAAKQKNYNKVTVTVDGDSTPYTIAIEVEGVLQTKSGVPDDGAASIKTIEVPSGYVNIDATALKAAGMELTGINSGDTVTVVEAGNVLPDSYSNLTISGTGTFTVRVHDTSVLEPTTTDVQYTAAGTGTISVKGGKGIEGVFALSKSDTLFSSTAATGTQIAGVRLSDATQTNATILVTVEKDENYETNGKTYITSISGLDTDETVVVTLANDHTVTYWFEDGVVIRKENDGTTDTVTKAGADAATLNTLDLTKLNYQPSIDALPLGGFDWGTSSDCYLSYSGTAATVKVTADPGTNVTTGTYIHAIYKADTKELTLEPVKGTAVGTVNPDESFSGTIAVETANGTVVNYKKLADDKFTTTFTNVGAGSTFTDLSGADKVTTGTLTMGASVTVNGGVYTTAEAGKALVFEGGRIVGGFADNQATSATVTLTNTSGTLFGAYEKISIGATSEVAVTFEGGVITSITKFGSADNPITIVTYKTDSTGAIVKDENGNYVEDYTTTYTQAGDTSIKRTITKPNGDTETSTLTITKDGNILEPSKDLVTSLKTRINMAAGTGDSAYFEVLTGTATATIKNDTGAATTDLDPTDGGERLFVRATITQDAKGDVLTLTPVSYKKGVLTETGVSANKINVIFTAIDKIVYNGSSDTFASVTFNDVQAGSVFTDLQKGCVVHTVVLNKATSESVTVNGKTYTAIVNGAFDIYAANPNNTYVINGKLKATKDNATIISTEDGTDAKTYQLTYTPGKKEDGTVSDNGVEVTYTDGVAKFTDLDDGEKVAIVNAGKTTTYERKGNYVYRTDGAGKVQLGECTSSTTEITAGVTYNDPATPTTGKFVWSDAATKGTKGYFLLEGDTPTATVNTQTSDVTISYANYGQTYLVATVSTGGGLTLQTQKVLNNGALETAKDLNGQVVTVNGIPAGTAITYARKNEKSITLNGIGAKSQISGTAGANDVITTTALAAATYKADGSQDKAAEYVTVYGKQYTAGGTSSTALSFKGDKVTGGTYVLSGTKGSAAATITATQTDSEGNIYTYVIAYDGSNSGLTKASDTNIAVTVSNGVVTSITGLGASAKDKGETVTITTTKTDKYGESGKPSITTYSALISTETGKAGQIQVTKDVAGTTSTHTFANDKQNILDSSATWAPINYAAIQDFDWKKTGYFQATLHNAAHGYDEEDADYAKFTATIEAQNGSTKIDADDYDTSLLDNNYYLKVEATKSGTAPATISSITLMKLNKDGSMTEYTAGTVGTVTIHAQDVITISGDDKVIAAGGFTLPTHTNKIVITSAEAGKTYAGLNETDTIEGAAAAPDTAYTVNGTKYTVQPSDFKMNGKGEMIAGVFTITGSATGTAKPAHDGDNVVNHNGLKYGAVLKSITYTAGEDHKDGVNVTFMGGRIIGVQDLEEGEKVVVTQVKGTAQTTGMTMTISKDDDKIVTKSIEFAGVSTPLVVKKFDNADSNVLAMTDFVAEKFDFGATASGKMGLFKVNVSGAAEIETQTAEPDSITNNGTYVVVGASQAASKDVTIDSLAVFATDANGAFDKAAGNDVLTTGITLRAPEGSLTLANGAEALYTQYWWDPDKKAYVEYTKEDTLSEKTREYTIAIEGAAAGKSYMGFGATDTVTGPLVSGDTITVAGKVFTLAGNNTISLRGDGKAINGVYTLGSGIDGASKNFADEKGTAADFTSKVTGASKAIVTFTLGEVTGIKDVAANDTVQIVKTNAKTQAVSTTIYKAEAITGDPNNLKITKTETIDGVTTTVTGTAKIGTDIVSTTWGPATSELSSNFDWTSASGSGYFLTEVTDTSKKLGTIEVKPTTTTAEVGKHYLKVALSGDGVVESVTLQKIAANGKPEEVAMSGVEGTVKITAPTTVALTYENKITEAGIAVEITGAIKKSVITMKAKDKLTTASLSAGDVLTVNGKKMLAGSTGTLEFADAGLLKNGAVEFTKDTAAAGLAITTTKGSFEIDGDPTDPDVVALTGAETPIVTVKDGVVTQIAGTTTATVKVTDAGGNIAVYGPGCKTIQFTTPLVWNKDITTAALAAGAVITGGGMDGFMAAEPKPLTLHTLSAAKLQLFDGTIQFASDAKAAQKVTHVLVTGADLTKTADDLDVAYTAVKGNNSTITVKVENGVVTSLKGLLAGDTVKYNGYTYTAETATKIKRLKDGDTEDKAVTAMLAKTGGDILTASYAVVDSKTDITDDPGFEGQFSWLAVDGRSTGYFKITEGKKGNTASIVEQSKKSSPTVGNGKTVKYVRANSAVAEEGQTTPQILSIDALAVTNTGGVTTVSSVDAKDLLANTKITVTAPTVAVNGVVPAISYTKNAVNDKYDIVLNKAAANSVVTGLDAGDQLTTATLTSEVYNKNGRLDGTVTGGPLAGKVTVDGIVYVAGGKGALVFVGEGDGAATTPTNKATLVKGTIQLDVSATYNNADDDTINNKKAILAGSADGLAANIEIALDDAGALDDTGTAYAAGNAPDKVLVTVDKGIVKSITGLRSKGMKLTVGDVTYKVLSVEDNYTWKDGVKTSTKTKTVTIARTQGTSTYYASFTINGDDNGAYYTGAGKNIYSDGSVNSKGVMANGYSPAVDTPTNTDKLWAETGKTAQVVYAEVNTLTNTTNFVQAATDPIKGSDETNRGKKYLAMTVKTVNGVSTIQKIEVAEVDATGTMKVLKGAPAKWVSGTGITINGANGTGFAKINYTIPKDVPVTITDAAIGSVITGAKGYESWPYGNLVTTAVTEGYTLAKGTVSLYKTVDMDGDSVKDTTAETKATYSFKAKGDSAKIDWDGTKISKLTGFETTGESLTIVENTEKGEQTTVYAVAKNSKTQVVEVTKTVTNADGTKKVYSCTVPSDAATYNWIDDPADGTKYLKLATAEVVSNFDWTLDKRNTGYFQAVTKNGVTSAAVKADTKERTIKNTDANTYVAVTISADGVLDSVRGVKMDTSASSETYGEMIAAKYSGAINVTAPTKFALTFDRSKVDTETTIADTATVAITGAVKNSVITNLAKGDTVTTAKLAVDNKKTSNKVESEWVTIGVADDAAGDGTFRAGAAGALGFKAQEVDGSTKLTLTSGTIELNRYNGETQGQDFAYVGNRMITMEHGNITVAASTKNNNTTFSVGDLKEGEVFKVESFGSGGSTKRYMRSGNVLFCEITTSSGTKTAVYELKTGTTVKSSVLDLAETAGAKATKNNPWVSYTESDNVFQETDKGDVLKNGKAVVADLKLLDSRIAADNKRFTDNTTYGTTRAYTFVIDKYIANAAKATGAASVIENNNVLNGFAEVQEIIGKRWGGYVYDAEAIAQTIKVTNKWTANGSDYADTIIGATSGKDTINGGMGNDTITGGSAADTFQFETDTAFGQNVVNNFGNGKDKMLLMNDFTDNTTYQDGFAVKLVTGGSGKSTTADVQLWYDDGDGEYEEGEDGVTLTKMGNGKAVNINGVDYYFGSSKASKAETFTYADNARYYANNAVNSGAKVNTLAISKTDKTKATANTLGDSIEVNLNATIGETDTLQYYGIRAVDASKSGNRVVLTASNVEEAKGSILKGGTYQSSLIGGIGNDSLYGGSGADTFWFESIEGQDTITNYAAAKDAVMLKALNLAMSKDAAGDATISASGSDVVISLDDNNKITLQKAVGAANAINIITDPVSKAKMSYYVGSTATGKGAKANNFTATLGKDMVIDTDVDGKELDTISMKSYYVGTDLKADDTLKLSSGKTVVTGKKFDMNADSMKSNLSSIDVIDTAGLKKGSTIELIGRESGTYTLKGSKDVTENFNLSKLTKVEDVANSVTITNLAVADVITLGDGVTATKTSGASTKNTYFELSTGTGDGKTVLGTVCVTGVAQSKFASSSYTGTIKRAN